MRHLFFFSEMDASVSWEKELRLAAEAVRMKTEEEKAITSGIGTAGRAASSGVDGAMAVPCRWCCLHCVAICITSYVSFVRAMYTAVPAGIKYQEMFPGTCVRVRARVPSPSPPRAGIAPEPEPSIRR